MVQPSSPVISASVGALSRTTMVTLCRPRIASARSTPSASHGVRASCAAAISSKVNPDGSLKRMTGSPKREARSVTAMPRLPSRARQKSSDPCGTENDVTVTWPAPLTPAGTPRSL